MTHSDPITKNLARAGEYFVLSIWVQSQMVDLIVLHRHPRIVSRFNKNIGKIPHTLAKERASLWQKDFGYIKKEFEKEFSTSLSEQARKDLDTVYIIRNAIGHSYVSLARNYLLYRPGSRKKLQEITSKLEVRRRENTARPVIIKLDFSNDEIYLRNFQAIQRLDEVHLKGLAEQIGISHSRIR